MNNNPSQLESLPNEILLEIFEYFDARDLYRAVYNLNTRFNILLQSLNELSLILSISDRDEINLNDIFVPHIHTLIIKYKTDIKFNYYRNIRRLILFWLPYTRPYKFETIILPYLEYLSINIKGSSSTNFSIHRLQETIFSNGFPCLKYCSLPKISSIQKSERWTKLPSLRILKVGHIGLFTYIAILSICINLNSFHFFEEKVFQTSIILLQQNIIHKNLKYLVIKDKYIGPITHAGVLNEYLSCVPNLEYLSIHGTTYDMKNLQYLFEFDWFASIISAHLIELRQFNFHLPIFRAKKTNKPINDETFYRLERYFKTMHKNRYKSCLIENRKNSKDLVYYDSSDLSD